MRSHVLVLTLAAAAPAAAQTVLFEDDLSDLSNWTVSGGVGNYTWYLFDAGDPCAAPAIPFPSGDHVARAGWIGYCTFAPDCDCGPIYLTLGTPVSIPAGAADVRLTFWSYDDVECASCDYDHRYVYVSDDGGASWTFVGESDQLLQWYQRSFDLTPWAGSDILVRFLLDPTDAFDNDGLGWLIDDVRLVADACAPPSNYCVAAPNSVGSGAIIGSQGSTSIAQDDFHLTLSAAPPKQFALFFYGPGQKQVPAGDGWLCVARGATGWIRITPPVKIAGDGTASQFVDYAASYSTKGWLTPGSTWNFQAWYRDPQGGPAGSNFSDGLNVTFCP